MRMRTACIILAVASLLSFCALCVGDYIYVPLQFPTIQAAIDAASDGDTIIVSDGIYYITDEIRFWGRQVTLKSENGPKNCVINVAANERGAFYFSGETRQCIVDGFTITQAHNRPGIAIPGDSSPCIINCIIVDNHQSVGQVGGGLKITTSGSPLIQNCLIMQNSAGQAGGGIYISGTGSPTIENCIIAGNTATSYDGGGVYCVTASPKITNCTVIGNYAGRWGAGIYISSVLADIANCIIWGNTGLDLEGRSATYSCVGSGDVNGTGNISADPEFVIGPLGDYYLSQINGGQAVDSPCIDIGSDLAANLGMDQFTTCTTNITDTGIVDMGYHYAPEPATSPVCLEPIPGDLNGDCKVDFKDFEIMASHWLQRSSVRIAKFALDTNPNWITEGQWQFGTPMGMGGSSHGYPDPNQGFTGHNVYGVNLNGDYTVSVGGPYRLIAEPFDCIGYEHVELNFARWLNTDTSDYVKCMVEVSNNGSEWQEIWVNPADTQIADNQWQQQHFDISSIADRQATVYVRWSYQILSDRAFPYSGWNIDDVELQGLPN
jgi:hypothetical protein